MADEKQTLDIPNGVQFSFLDNTISLGNEHDVFIRGDLGYKMKKIFSKAGNVQLLPPEGVELEIEEIEAPQGEIYISGRVKSNTIRAQKVFFQQGSLKANRIKAEKEVHLKGKQLNIQYVGAPTVEIEPDCRGLCLVVECKHEVPKGDYTGGFRTIEEARETFSMFVENFESTGGSKPAAAPAAPRPASIPVAGGGAASPGPIPVAPAGPRK